MDDRRAVESICLTRGGATGGGTSGLSPGGSWIDQYLTKLRQRGLLTEEFVEEMRQERLKSQRNMLECERKWKQ